MNWLKSLSITGILKANPTIKSLPDINYVQVDPGWIPCLAKELQNEDTESTLITPTSPHTVLWISVKNLYNWLSFKTGTEVDAKIAFDPLEVVGKTENTFIEEFSYIFRDLDYTYNIYYPYENICVIPDGLFEIYTLKFFTTRKNK